MRTSLRLTPSAQRKNRVVTRIKGATYRRSVIGAEVVISLFLCQRPVQVHVPAVHKDVLAGDVSCPVRKEKYYHCGDFLRCGHSFSQRNFCQDGLECFLWI